MIRAYRRGAGRDQNAHMALWRPFIRALMQGLAKQASDPPVYLLLGGFAKELYQEIMGDPGDLEAGRAPAPVRTVAHWHPAYSQFLESNSLDEVNGIVSGKPITW